MNNKQKLVYLSLIALTIIGILSGASYAYFSIENKIGNETVIESGTMALTLEDGATITADNLIPGEYIEKEFTVRNTGTVRTNYDIYLSEVVNTFVNQSDLVYEIISSNGYNTSNQVQVPNTETKIINNYPIDPLKEHTYTLRITYKLTNEVQNDNMGRTFIAKINVNEYNSNNSETYIKLIDSSNNLLDKQVITNNTDYYYNLNNYDLTNSTNIYCNNGSIPTIENNTLKVSEVTTATDCKISNSINTTITNLPNTKTGIVMTNNQDGMTSMSLTNKEVVLDLNGKTINGVAVDTETTTWNEEHCGFRLDTSTLTVNDTIGSGGIYTGKDGRVFLPIQNSNLTINGGSYNGRQSIYADRQDNNNIIINNGSFYSKVGDVISLGPNNSNSIITINNGSFYPYSTTNRAVYIGFGTVNITRGNFKSDNITILNNNGTINITGGVFKSTGNNTIYNATSGRLNIDGNQAIFDSNGNYVSGIYIYNDSTADVRLVQNSGIMTINNGTFISYAGRTIQNYGGNITINNGYFKSFGKDSLNVWNNATMAVDGGTANINDGYFESLKGFGIISETENSVNIKKATINSYNYAINNQNYDTTTTNICRLTLTRNKVINNVKGYIYYHTNAFGSVTPTFNGTTANIQIKDSVCD